MEGLRRHSALVLLHAVYLCFTIVVSQSLEKLGVVHVLPLRRGNKNEDVALLPLFATMRRPLLEVDVLHETFARVTAVLPKRGIIPRA